VLKQKGENEMGDAAQIQKIKAQVFDVIRKQEAHQAQINALQQTKADMLRELQRLEMVKPNGSK